MSEQSNWSTTLFWRNAAVLIFFCIAAVLLYSKAANGPFIFDDYCDIVDNSHIHITSVTFDSLKDVCVNSNIPSRPVANISFALGHYFHGLNPFWFRAVNIAIHILASFFLFLFFKTTLNLPFFTTRHSNLVPFFASLIFLVHPVQTQAVSYIVQRMTSMAAMFYILTMLLYVKGRIAGQRKNRMILYVLAASSFFLAIGTKEIAATLPVVILMYEWFFLQDLKWDWPRQNLSWLAGGAILFCVVALILMRFYPSDISNIFFNGCVEGATTYQRLLTQFRVVVFYISLLFWPLPTRMNLDHDFLASTSFIDPAATWLCAMIIAGLLAWALFSAKKHRLISFAILWFFGNLVIESTVIGLELIFEHRLYLPSIMIYLVFTGLIFTILRNKLAATALLCSICILLSAGTLQRNKLWGDHMFLWMDCVKKSPEKCRPNYNFGKVLAESGRTSQAVIYYKKAVSIDPDYSKARTNLGRCLVDLGMIDKGLEHINRAIELNPTNPKAHLNAGYAFLLTNKLEKAIWHFGQAITLDPTYTRAYNNLAIAFAKSGNLDQAIVQMAEVLKLDPKDYRGHFNLAKMLSEQGRTSEAVKHYKAVLVLKPGLKAAQQALKNLLKQPVSASP